MLTSALPKPPFTIAGLTFLSPVGIMHIPRGRLVTWYVFLSPVYAAEIAANVDGKISAAFDAHHIIDCEPITPVLDEPSAATHVLTIREYDA